MNRVAIGQICSSSSLKQNLDTIQGLIQQALDKDVKVIFFPEASDYLSRSANHSRQLAGESPEFVQKLSDYIKSVCSSSGKKIDVSIGVHLPPDDADLAHQDTRVKNCLIYIDHSGVVRQSYQKLHLFDVDAPNGPILRESRSVQAGATIPAVLNTPAGKLGNAICFDIRFPELSLKLRSEGAQILCFPSAFTMKTGEAHWELLGRARAVDTQCFVIMPGQQGHHNVSADGSPGDATEKPVERISWGHSMIIDPWGTVISRADPANDAPQLITADLDFGAQAEMRQNMPLWDQRRRDVFGDFI
ncbi:LAMI_0G14334g1_1 [Lachancea mirantina]|uniref:LAMI_0G14334g1_1 n=1 Tax=Lachancea mirantina TaxID=1230905 RepID=A0A1G4KC01_9SACH|nr:LAMI_0G14334g1_1 [Lachancea mirantina]